MDLPQVDTCCFGLFPLRTGTLIIGIVTFLMELAGHGYSLTYGNGYTGIIHTIYILLIILGIVASALLIFGVYYNQRRFVLFFLIIYGLLVVATIVLTVIYFMRYQGHAADTIVSAVIYCLVILYCLIVVNSYYKIM